MLVILARHGNTFETGQTPVWAGANEDFPLTDKGLEQSRAVGEALARARITPDRILSGPLKRTRTGARLAGEACGFAGEVEIDERLREIDYGVWGALADAEIEARWGRSVLEAWRERSEFPEGAGWSPSRSELMGNARDVLEAVTCEANPDTAVLIVTSNGILRFFHVLLGGDGAGKAATGHMAAARIEGGEPRLLFWNLPPDAASKALKS